MTTIKPLPQSLSSLVRSGIVLFDLTRVVEELVFNSLDASAKKVSVFVGVGNFSLKVVDNGSGVTRDDLVLLGGRYATSKCWPSDDTGTTFGSFGSRGEALASISDVSLIEMITKTHGSPNGYRKILKGCKCLHLGIDDDIQDVGTTVIVRDLFYNQPIRRKYIQSSPRKVLDSIKKCILRIALVNTEISFKVVDIESGNELLCTEPSSSPLSLLQRTFGIDICNALRELKASEGVLNLTGHISGPGDDFSFKAFQYVYINSQFICKGPIHKAVNQLAAKFEFSNSWDTFGLPNGKRNRPRACPAYLLRLSCPRSLYDLSFEPSKTCVEFKDWNPILAFVENAVQQFWKEREPEGRYSHTFSEASGQNLENCVSGREDLPSEETNHFSGVDKLEIPFQDCDPSRVKFTEQRNEIDSFLHIDHFLHRDYSPVVKCRSSGILRGEDNQCRFNNTFCFNDASFGCAEGNVLGEERRRDSYLRVNCLSSAWKEKSHDINSIISNEPGHRSLSFDSPEDFVMGRERKKPFLQSCSSQVNLPLNGLHFPSDKGFQTDDFKRKQKQVNPRDDDIHLPRLFPMMSWHEEERDSLLIDNDTSYRYTRPLMEEDSFSWSCDLTEVQNASSSGCSLNSNWSSVISDPLPKDTWDGLFHVDGTAPKSSLSSKRTSYEHPPDKMGCKFWVREETSDISRGEVFEQNHAQGKRSRRSYSAPPFHRQKRWFDSLSHLRLVDRMKPDTETCLDAFSCPGAGKLEGGTIHCSAAKQQSSAVSFSDRQEIQKYFEVDPGGTENDKDSILGEIQESRDSGVKWRETCLQTRSKPLEGHDESNILDISSGFLHLAGDSLVPKSISKDCLFNAKVLQQVDKKFIPVVGGGALVVIDQHAADERIRLEDLRQKVLSGEVKTISYLDSEKELLLPEIGYQLLRDYGEQIKEWGWICNIHSQCSGSFTKNLNLINRQRTAITLLAVPCILGVNLTDVDLLEFLQQLVDTDGASTMPPAVVRVLNLKACRGAIMFGDSLLPSECSLIVEELKQTSLCFQCAHGRPTTVPLVNLDALHKQIPKLCGVNAPSNEPWHGLRRHGLSLQRSARRLRLAMS
ncbi:DNA mismatch repair protein MLH3 isoform X2 [Punica granatum]|uniref:DNA mismatch repair protein MLH3 isoform X2 n=1 Tax=Punica granatum TaxID=22663 RepID=A0A6P8CLJ2_PUNGR|nr:DNA mismatch repair protein MLH3 isoform X2 [Punica granatum]